DLRARRCHERGTPFERGPPILVHLTVHFSARDASLRFELVVCGLRTRTRRFSQVPRRADRAFALAHHSRERPEQQPVQRNRQQQHAHDDADNRQIRDHLISLATNGPSSNLYHWPRERDKVRPQETTWIATPSMGATAS